MEKIRDTQSSLPGEADLLEWFQQVRRGEPGEPRLLLTGLSERAGERREIGILDVWPKQDDPAKIVLRLPKPDNHPAVDNPWTDHWFDAESVWLIQAHLLYGGEVAVKASQVGKRPDLPEGWFYVHLDLGRGAEPNVNRLIANVTGRHLAEQVGDHHDHTRANIRTPTEDAWVRAHGRENVRSVDRSAREDAIAASVKLWRAGGPFPSAAEYEATLRFVYDVLDQRHPLARR